MKITTVMANRTGGYLVNAGLASVCTVDLNPAANDPNATDLLAWLRNNQAAPWVPSLDEARANAYGTLMRWVEAFTTPLTAKYPRVEQDMWPLKLPAAHAIVSGTATALDELMFAEEAALVGGTIVASAAATVAKGTAFARISSAVSGLRQHLETGLASAETAADVPVILAEVMTRADALAATFGLPSPTPTGV